MVKSTGTGPAGSSMSLKDVVKEIKETNKKLDAQGTALTDFIAELKFQKGTQGLENKREGNTKGKGKGSGIPLLSPIANLNKEGLGLGLFLNPAALLKGLLTNLSAITGGILAITAATAGLRGWALTPIESIKKWKGWGKSITDGAKALRNALFLSFGLTEAGDLTRDTKGRFQKRPITTKIGMRMNALRLSTLKAFGLDNTGKLAPNAKIDPKLTKPNLFQRFKFQFGRVMNPIRNISNGIAKFAGGVGKPIFKFFSTIGAAGGGILGKIGGVFGKILAPLGFFLSFKSAFDKWMTSEESSVMKQSTDFIGDFLSNFLGAPLDLIKNLIFKVAELVGFEVNDEGVFKSLKELSIEKLLGTVLKNVFDIPRKVFNFLVESFTNPEYFKEQWTKFKGKLNDLLDKVFGFITGIFSSDDEKTETNKPQDVKDMSKQEQQKLLQKNKDITLQRLSMLRNIDTNNDGIITEKEARVGAFYINKAFGGSGKAQNNLRNLIEETGSLDLNAAEAQAQAMPIIIDGSTTNGPSTQNITNLTPMGDVSEPYSKDYMRSLFGG